MAITPATLRRARLDTSARAGKPCGASYIPMDRECRKGLRGLPPAGPALTPGTLAKAPRRGTGEWQRKAAIAAGVGASAAAIGLPLASFAASGTPAGRRQTAQWARAASQVESMAMRGLVFPAAWPIAAPIAGGAMAAKEGINAARKGRRVIESWRTAPGFAKGAAGLAGRKTRSAAERKAVVAQLEAVWMANDKSISVAEARRRAAQIRRAQQRFELLQRQAATRARAARRSARIARTGAPFRSSPTPSETWLRQAFQVPDPVTRAPASLTAALLRSLQGTRRGLTARKPRLYG